MFKNKRSLILVLLTGLFFLFISSLISHFALSSFSSILITYESDRSDKIGVYYSLGRPAIFTERRSTFSSEIPAERKTVVRLALNNRQARRLRLDPGDKPGQIKLYRLELKSNFATPIILEANDLHDRFKPNSAIGKFELKDNHVLVEVKGEDPHLVIKDNLVLRNRFISIVLPLAFTIAFYLVASTFNRNSFPAFYDLSHHRSSANINYASLDGIRGIAVLLVLLEHTWRAFHGAGIAGVWIFFVLSGFLLAIPFVRKPELAVSSEYMSEYLLRRLKRIIPMYYFFIVIALFLKGRFAGNEWRHLLFLQGDGYLWSIPQEMLFYLFLPFIMVGNYLLFRGRPLWIVIGLFVLMILANTYLGKSVLSIYGQNVAMPAFVGIFVCGILFSYFYHGIVLPNQDRIVGSIVARHLFSILGIAVLFSYVLFSTDTLFSPNTLLAPQFPGWFAVSAGVMILLVLVSPRTVYDRLLSWTPLRAIGLVGFSFYLLHPVVIGLTRTMQDYYLGFRLGTGGQLVIIFVVTYFLSAFTYSYIERPFLKRTKKSETG